MRKRRGIPPDKFKRITSKKSNIYPKIVKIVETLLTVTLENTSKEKVSDKRICCPAITFETLFCIEQNDLRKVVIIINKKLPLLIGPRHRLHLVG